VEKIKESYTVRILHEDRNGNIVSTYEKTYNSYSEYKSVVATIPARTQVTTTQGVIAIYDSIYDIFGATLKCHDVNGEVYYVVFTRNDVTLAAYSDDSIRTRFETWANTVPSLTRAKENPK
jgi:hypothetical protein